METNVQQTRLIEALTYLKRYKNITQAKLAEMMGTTQTSISRNIAASGIREINKDFIASMNLCVGNIFNLDYIINGRGKLLVSESKNEKNDDTSEYTPNIIELYAQLIKEVEALRSDLTSELQQVRDLRTQLSEDHKNLQRIATQFTVALSGAKITSYTIHQPDIELAADDPNNQNL